MYLIEDNIDGSSETLDVNGISHEVEDLLQQDAKLLRRDFVENAEQFLLHLLLGQATDTSLSVFTRILTRVMAL